MKSKNSTSHGTLKDFLYCCLSGLLLGLSFPKFDLWFLAWIGLIPLFFVLDRKSPREAFKTAYVTGVVFFALTLYWVGYVTVIGTIALVLYCAVYFGFFGLWYAWIRADNRPFQWVFIASGWTALEYAKANVLSGFSWSSLCLSQYKNLPMIQVSDITSMYGVTFLIVGGNLIIKETIGALKNRKPPSHFFRDSSMYLFLIVLTFFYGQWSLGRSFEGPSVNVSVIQANIPQEIKWDERQWPEIMKKYEDLSSLARDSDDPDLIVWPETAFPGIINDKSALIFLQESIMKKLQKNVLFGAIIQREDRYFNSAILSTQGDNYEKLHLVPFGEYIPLRALFPILGEIIPIADFTAGLQFTLFSLPDYGDGQKFAVMICFEDTIPWLAKRFTDKGAGLLMNITNDAWFHDSSEPFMHLQSSVFRAVENRRYLVRAANTGISGFISPHGRFENMVMDPSGKMTFVEGISSKSIPFLTFKSFHTKFGDFFTLIYFGCILWEVKRKRTQTKQQKRV